MAQLLLTGSTLTSGSNLDQALQLVESRLKAWASSSNSDAYNALLLEVFGVQSSEATGALQAALGGTGLGISLEILDGATLRGINGAYTSAAPGGGERIYLNGAWLQTATAAEIEAVLLEELGHAIDHNLNGAADSPGDEGEIFSARLRGLAPASSAFSENDHRLISLEGQPVFIEADEVPQISVTAIANGNEANGNPAVFRFSRNGSTTNTLSVSYRLLGTAQTGSDYTGATTGTINFSAGSATAELSLPVLADSVIDPGETIMAQIVADPAATPSYLITPGQQTATATITAEGMVVAVNGPSRPGCSKGENRNSFAFAALKSDGTVVAWGDSPFGGTTPAGLSGVTQIFSTDYAFAALKSDGTVVAWGNSTYGGTTPAGLSGVTQIFSTDYAFAALKSDGTVVAWGSSTNGGTTPAGLSGVTQIFSTDYAFAALKSDGTVVAWGSSTNGGTTPAGLSGVTQIFSTGSAFAALKSDGTVVAWGYSPYGGTTPAGLSGVTQIFSNAFTFAALKSDGTVVAWGSSTNGGTTPAGLSGVTQIFSTGSAFAALKSDGTVVAWGISTTGGTTPAGLSGVTQIFSTDYAFAALKSDGTVVAWGNSTYGGTTPAGLSGVTQIFSNDRAFAALKSDGTVVAWGDSANGGTTPAGLSGVTQIFSTDYAFAALKSDGTVVAWGISTTGGTTPAGLSGVVGFANPQTNDRLLLPPTITSVTDDAGTITGTLTTGGRTDDTNLTVKVTLPTTGTLAVAGDTIQLYNSSTALGSAYTLLAADITDGFANVATGTLTDGTSYTINAKVIDRAGNASSASGDFSVTVDTTPPIVADANISISGATGTEGVYKIGDMVTAVYDPGDQGLELSSVTVDFSQFGGGSAVTATLQNSGDNRDKYVATYSIVSGDLDTTNSNVSVTATDNAGNPTTTADSTDASVDSIAPIGSLDGVAPVSSTTADGSYGIGERITLTVEFSEAVVVNTTGGTPRLQLETGSTDHYAFYSGGSGTTTLSFLYGVQVGDHSTDLDQLSAEALQLNGGTIQDAAGNNAILTLAAPGAAGSLGVNAALVIDAIAPTITEITVQGNQLLLQFSEGINSTGLLPATFGISVAGLARTVSAIGAGSDASQLLLTLAGTAPTNDQTVSLTYTDLTADNDSSGVIQDSVGNDLATIAPARNADTYSSAADVTSLATTYANLTLTGTATSGSGNAGNNTIRVKQATPVANVLTGGAGTDSIDGAGGSDVYIVGSSLDHPAAEISDSGNSGTDELRFSSSTAAQTLTVFAADTGLERVTIGTGTAADPVLTGTTALNIDASLAPNLLTITGNAGINSIIGSAYADVITGNAGNDSLDGGNGSDIYLISSSADRTAAEIKDSGTTGTDELRFSSITAAQTLTVYAAETGLELVTIGTGTAANADLSGTTALNVDASLAPNALTIKGNAAVNVITGTTATDTLDGGNGGDLYLISTSSQHTAAEINDSGTTGTDELRFSSTTAAQTLTVYAADTGLELVTIGTGSAAAPVLTGTTALNVNASLAPNALTITGNAGANSIIGSAFADVITGNAGNDSLDGGNGGDLYLIASSADRTAAEIKDTGASGTDELRFSSITAAQTLTVYAAETGLELVTIGTGTAANADLSGTTALNVDASLAPNALTIKGNAAVNVITGTTATDTLDGGNGGDLYLISTSSQHTAAEINDSGTTGTDELRFSSTTAAQTLTVYAADTGLELVTIGTGSAAAPVLTGTTALNVNASLAPNALTITGNAGANSIIGGASADVITGNAGNDSLDGGNGGDLYLIASSADRTAAEIKDTGASGTDELRFSSITAAQTLTVYAAETGLELVTIGTGTAANADLSGTTALNVDASLAPNALTIKGNAAVNVITGTTATDTLDGGNGGDLYLISNSTQHTAAEISDSGTTGTDELRFSSSTAAQSLTVYAADTGLELVTIGTGSAAAPVLTGTTALNVNASLAPNALTITGNAGANSIIGSAFADVITGNAGNDSLDGGNGGDLYLIASSADRTAAEIKDTGAAGTDELRFSSTTAAQTLTVYAAETGLERVTIGTGSAADPVLTGTTALNVDASLAPNALTIKGNAGVNVITGTTATDTLDGGNGADLYLISNSTQHTAAEISDSGTTGTDELRFSSSTAAQTLTVYAADTGLELVTIGTGSAAAPVLTGTTALNVDASLAPNALTIKGNAGVNVITGTTATDTLDGGNGGDIYLISNSTQHTAAEIKDTGTAGLDELRFSSTTAAQTLTVYAADTGLERVTVGTGSAADPVLTGTTALSVDASLAPNALTIKGNAGVNVIIGTAFVDTLDGGNGGDLYLISNSTQHTAAEIGDSGASDSGTDELRFSSSTAAQTLTVYAADTGLERVTIGTGSAADPVLTGTTALNVDASLAPNALTIKGNAGVNVITGTTATDTLDGGNGGDLYLISNSTQHTAAEISDSGTTGTDELRFSSSTAAQTLTVYAADTGLERVTIGSGSAADPVLTGTTALNVDASLAPNALTITGNAGANSIIGGASADVITGNAGNDSLDGGNGGDLYLIASSADRTAAEIKDTGAAGTDELRFSSTTAAQTLTVYAAETGLERVTIGTGTAADPVLTGTTALNVNASLAPNALTITGNAGANSIIGGASADVITGNAGNDSLNGGNGGDIYLIGSSADRSAAEIKDSGTTGTDELRFSSTTAAETLAVYAAETGLELVSIGTGTAASADLSGTTALNVDASLTTNALRIQGNAGDNVITGTVYADQISGNEGNDSIIGGRGNDSLSGGTGADIFRFDTAPNGSINFDAITDFLAADGDIIQLENAVYTALTTTGTLADIAFANAAMASTSAQRVLYNSSNGQLLYDSDGSGSLAPILFATLSTGLTLSNTQFTVT